MKVLTANRLSDGVVVYLARNGWTHLFDEAQRLEPEAADVALKAAQGQSRALVAPYLVDVSQGEIERRERLRETIRAHGPTVGHSLNWGAG
jgi:hypothetical protein